MKLSSKRCNQVSFNLALEFSTSDDFWSDPGDLGDDAESDLDLNSSIVTLTR